MKLTKQQLKQLIKEELQNVLQEAPYGKIGSAFRAATSDPVPPKGRVVFTDLPGVVRNIAADVPGGPETMQWQVTGPHRDKSHAGFDPEKQTLLTWTVSAKQRYVAPPGTERPFPPAGT
jgi:hypothetical protein